MIGRAYPLRRSCFTICNTVYGARDSESNKHHNKYPAIQYAGYSQQQDECGYNEYAKGNTYYTESNMI